MPKLNSEIKERIKSLKKDQLEEIVIKLASKDQSVYDYLFIHYLEKELGEEELYEKTIEDLKIICRKNYKGFSEQLQIANMLAACTKRINEFMSISNNKLLEAKLLMLVLEIPFSYSDNIFGTCFTRFDNKIAQMVKRLVTIVTTKLHPDYKVEFENEINSYLTTLHKASYHVSIVKSLPKTI